MSRRRGVGSNRRQKPATAARRLALAYQCGSCAADVREVTRDEFGIDHVNVVHDDHCPVLSGAVSDSGDIFRAASRAGIAALAVRVADGGEDDD